jgi:hypothetical protein
MSQAVWSYWSHDLSNSYVFRRSPLRMTSMYPSAVRQRPVISDTLDLAILPGGIRHCFLSSPVLGQSDTHPL